MTRGRPQQAVVVGAGLAGLACARTLASAGTDVVVLEASSGVGGRARTDREDGFLLDRGFQVLLTSYPDARAMLDLGALAPGRFARGALVMLDQGACRVPDPLRSPVRALATLASPVASPGDAVALARLWRRSWRGETRASPSSSTGGSRRRA